MVVIVWSGVVVGGWCVVVGDGDSDQRVSDVVCGVCQVLCLWSSE